MSHVRRYTDGGGDATGPEVPSVAPKFCACCLEERRGLTPVDTQSKGATAAARVTWLCVDCVDQGALADLAQHDLTDGRQNAGAAGFRDGNRQVGRKR